MKNKRYLIGQWVVFDISKQLRDFKEDFYGVELCLIEKESDISDFLKYAQLNNINYGVHFPLRANQWKLRDPQFLSKSLNTKNESYQFMTQELNYISKLNPKYVLIHYPKPMLLNEKADWSVWRFADTSEYYYQNDYDFDLFMQNSQEFFEFFTSYAKKHNFIPIIELDIVNEYVYASKEFYELFLKFPTLKVCLDIARLHLQSTIDSSFPVNQVIDLYAKHTYLVHLSNLNPVKKINHYPALPSLKTEDGWANIEPYLKRIKSHNNDFKLQFEHRSYLVSDEELNSCYNWIRDILK